MHATHRVATAQDNFLSIAPFPEGRQDFWQTRSSLKKFWPEALTNNSDLRSTETSWREGYEIKIIFRIGSLEVCGLSLNSPDRFRPG